MGAVVKAVDVVAFAMLVDGGKRGVEASETVDADAVRTAGDGDDTFDGGAVLLAAGGGSDGTVLSLMVAVVGPSVSR
jgi:hypothetical protein